MTIAASPVPGVGSVDALPLWYPRDPSSCPGSLSARLLTPRG